MGIFPPPYRAGNPAALAGAAGGAPAAPLGGEFAWFRASSGTWQNTGKTTAATANNDPVRTWADLSGNGRDLTCGDDTHRPLFKTGIINSQPALLWDGSNDRLLASFTLNAPWTLLLVWAYAATGTDKVLWSGGNTGADCYLNRTSAGRIQAAGGGSTVLYTTLYPDPLGANVWSITRHSNDAASSTVHRRNAGSTQTSGALGTLNLGGMTLGAYNSAGTVANWSNLYVAELVVYSSILSTGDETTVRNFLNAIYAVF